MRDANEKTAELYRSLGPRVYRRCLRILEDEQAALDATQEVFLKLWVNMPRLEDRAEVLPWILNVTRNHCLNVRRATRKEATLAEHLERQAPPAGADVTRTLLARALLDRSDPAMRRVVLAVIGAGLRHEDAAAALGMSPAAVARKVQRFLARTREYLTKAEYLEARGVVAEETPSSQRPSGEAPARTPPLEAERPTPARAARPRASGRQYAGDALDPAA